MDEFGFIQNEMDKWGEGYINDLLDRGYVATQLEVWGRLRWWWVLPTSPTSDHSRGSHDNRLLTQA